MPHLLEAGFRVRRLVRDSSRLQGRPGRDQVALIVGDVLRLESLTAVMADAMAAAASAVAVLTCHVGFAK